MIQGYSTLTKPNRTVSKPTNYMKCSVCNEGRGVNQLLQVRETDLYGLPHEKGFLTVAGAWHSPRLREEMVPWAKASVGSANYPKTLLHCMANVEQQAEL